MLQLNSYIRYQPQENIYQVIEKDSGDNADGDNDNNDGGFDDEDGECSLSTSCMMERMYHVKRHI